MTVSSAFACRNSITACRPGAGEQSPTPRHAEQNQARFAVRRFPSRRSRAVFVFPGTDDPWWVVAGSHGWIHGNVASAWADAEWLSDNLGYPIRLVGD
jgi:hypothetical protein